MHYREFLCRGLITVILAGCTAPIIGEVSHGVEWRRAGATAAEDPATLLRRAEELIERATKAASAEQQAEAPAGTWVAEGTVDPTDDKPNPELPNPFSKDLTIRLVIGGSGSEASSAISNAYEPLVDNNAPAPPNNLGDRREAPVEPRLSPAPEWNFSRPTPLLPSAPRAMAGQSPEGRISSARADYFAEVALAQMNEEAVAEASDNPSASPPPEPYMGDTPLLLPNGQLGSSCGDACCPPPRPLICVAGVEATFLRPDLNREGGTSFTFQDGEDVSENWTSAFTDGIDSMYLSPRIWLGVQGCKWGANVRYWHLRACEGDFNPATDEINGWDYDEWDWEKTPDVGYFTDNCLDAYTIDLELTRRFCLHDCAMQAALGVRHGSIENDESVVGTVLGDESRFMAYGHSSRFSRGTGILLGLYGRKPLFPSSCIHWFYNARWSALWGKTGTSAETFAAVTIDGGNSGSVNGASTCVNDTLIIGEIQLGLEWNYALQCLPANAFIRTAVEYQRWDGGKGYSEAGSFARYSNDDDIESTARTFASAAEPQMDLVGLSVGTGLTW